MNFDYLINDFARTYGLSLSNDTKGICHFLVNDTIAISLEKSLDGKGFFLYAVLTKIPPGQENRYALTALDGNLFGKETEGSSIGYDPHTQSLILFRYFDEMHTQKNDFEQGFTTFLQIYAYWINKLKSLSS